MTFLHRHGNRPLFAVAAAACVAASTMGAIGATAAVRPAPGGSGAASPAARARDAVRGAGSARASSGMYATLFFSRSEVNAADNCQPDHTGIARMATVVAPYLHSLGMTGTGSLVTAKTGATSNLCTHSGDSLTASWAQATSLAKTYGWSFVSATATYPANLASLPPKQQQAETCGSARTIDNHGLPGGHGMIAYPGAQGLPVAVQAQYGARCFAWGRQYQKSGTTLASMGTTAPYWQYTRAFNGGPCNDPAASCYTISASGSVRYAEPSALIALVNALQPGQWLTLQSYILVTGKNPPYTSNGTRWDCSSTNPALHWTNDVERYCYTDFQQVVQAIAARGDITVTDPLTVGVAFGRPATYP